MRRVALATVVAFLSFPVLGAPCAGFTDVDDSSSFCVNVEWIKNRGITLGCTATQYCPHDYVTRLQMAAFLYRLGFQNAFLQGGNAFGATAGLGTTDNQALHVHVNSTRVMRYEPNAISPNVIGGSPGNFVSAGGVRGATIAGGGAQSGVDPDFNSESPNVVSDAYGTVGGGSGNLAGNEAGAATDAAFATIGGGRKNRAIAPASTVAGGEINAAIGGQSTVAGGSSNTATGPRSAVGGGIGNQAIGGASTVAGGDSNTASGPHSTVAGGAANLAAGSYSFAAGNRASANQSGCFVYSDSSSSNPTSCFGVNEIVIRGLGGFYFFTGGNSDATYTGAQLPPGTSAWSAYSDRNGKERIEPVDSREVLDKLVAMPIATWQWKSEPGAIRHMGPMAQDFRRAFGLGGSDKQIVTVDADGVALAAIQGLNAKLEAQLQTRDALIDAQRAEIAELRRAVDLLLARTGVDGKLAQSH